MGWRNENTGSFVAQSDIKMDSHGNLHLLVATTGFTTKDKAQGYAIKLIEQTSLTAEKDAAQCQEADKIKDLRASRTFVKLTAKPSKYMKLAPLVWQEDDIGQSKSVIMAGPQIVILKTGMYLARGCGSGAGQFAFVLDGSEIAKSESNGRKKYFAHLFKLKHVGIIAVKHQTRGLSDVSFFDLTIEEME